MDLILLFFALPIATIILAIVLEKILKCPILVAATFFAIFLIVTFSAFDSDFFIFAIIYTMLAYIAAAITRFICNNFCRNGVFRNINAQNINTNTLRAREIINNNDNDDDNDNDKDDDCYCNCSCHSNHNNYNFNNHCLCSCNNRGYNNYYTRNRGYRR